MNAATTKRSVLGHGRVEAVIARSARPLGLSAGQAYTVLTGVVIGVALAAVGLPPVLSGVADAVPPAVAAPVAVSVDEASAPPSEATPSTQPDVVPGPLPETAVVAPSPVPPPPEPAPVEAPAPPPTTTRPPPEPHTVAVFADFEHDGVVGAIAAAADGTVYVASDDAADAGSHVVALDPDGAVVDEWQIEGQPTNRRRGVAGIAVVDGTVAIADASRSRLLWLDPDTGTIDVGPAIPDVPACLLGIVTGSCEPGLLSSPPDLTGIAVAPDGAYYVSDRGQGIVWRVRGDDVRPFVSFEDRLPGQGPVGVTVDRYGDLIVPVSARLLTLPPGLAGIYLVNVIGSRAATPRLVFEFGDSAGPSDIVVGDSGRAYVTVPGPGRVLDIGLDSGDLISVPPGDIPFVRPSSVAMVDGALLVAGQGPTPRRWVVHSISILDRPAEQR